MVFRICGTHSEYYANIYVVKRIEVKQEIGLVLSVSDNNAIYAIPKSYRYHE